MEKQLKKDVLFLAEAVRDFIVTYDLEYLNTVFVNGAIMIYGNTPEGNGIDEYIDVSEVRKLGR